MFRAAFNFRTTAGYVQDRAGEVLFPVPPSTGALDYPNRVAGYDAGTWRGYYMDVRDRSSTVDRRLAGFTYSDAGATDGGIVISLPQGLYCIHGLAADTQYGNGATIYGVIAGLNRKLYAGELGDIGEGIVAVYSIAPFSTTQFGRFDGQVFSMTDVDRFAYGGGIPVRWQGGPMYIGRWKLLGSRYTQFLISHLMIEQVSVSQFGGK